MKNLQTPAILLVDDDEDDLQMLNEAFHELCGNCTLLQAGDGIEALQILAEQKAAGNLPNLIVLDVNMPRMDGRETLTAIQNDQTLSSIPLVVFTTSSSQLDKRYFERKKIKMITKPFDMKTLYAAAKEMLGLV